MNGCSNIAVYPSLIEKSNDYCIKDKIFSWTKIVTSQFLRTLHTCAVWRWPTSDVWIGILGGAICLEPRCCSLTGVFGDIVLLKHPFQWHFFFGIMQHDPPSSIFHSILWLDSDKLSEAPVIKRNHFLSPLHKMCNFSLGQSVWFLENWNLSGQYHFFPTMGFLLIADLHRGVF